MSQTKETTRARQDITEIGSKLAWELIENFRDIQYPHMVNKDEMVQYLQDISKPSGSKGAVEVELILKRLETIKDIKEKRLVEPSQIEKALAPNIYDRSYFDDVTSKLGWTKNKVITARQIEEINNKYSLGISKEGIQAMIAKASYYGQPVTLDSIFRCLVDNKK